MVLGYEQEAAPNMRLEIHLKKHPNDKQALELLKALREGRYEWRSRSIVIKPARLAAKPPEHRPQASQPTTHKTVDQAPPYIASHKFYTPRPYRNPRLLLYSL